MMSSSNRPSWQARLCAVRAHQKIKAAGGQSDLEIFDGMFHGWHMLDGIIPEARAALTRVAEFLARHVEVYALRHRE